jgi:large subunit ribosomal protein L5
MVEKFNFKNKLQAARLEKIVVNMGVGQGAHDGKVLEEACNQLAQITGQKPIITRARKAIANFKIRKGSAIGCKVTLRGVMMYEFFDRLISVALPRIKDFRGLSKKSFDAFGNYTFGINEQTIFPEIEVDRVKRLQGMDITIVINARSKGLAQELLRSYGFPFQQQR